MFKTSLTILALIGASQLSALAVTMYSNGFETDTAGWTGPSRVASGNGGITSASGNFHAIGVTPATQTTVNTPFTTWGGYNYGAGNAVPTAFQDYTTSLDIFLNVEGGWANETRFDFSSAINKAAGTFMRDFIFNAGFYNDATGPGANTNRFVISASTNSQPGSAYAKNPAMDPFAISTTGWYTFEHHFYDNAGTLAVDLSILDSSSTLVNSWTLSNPADLISATGGNRYGWFDYNQFSSLAFDNAELRTNTASVPDGGATVALLGGALAGLGLLRRKFVA
ncbi:MAG: VPDSG-CTERM sorting domain-containing protein [Verrucomicrobiota bacterium]